MNIDDVTRPAAALTTEHFTARWREELRRRISARFVVVKTGTDPDPGSWVYVLTEEDGDRVKVGFTAEDDPMSRISGHQKSSSQGRALEVAFVLRAGIDVERTLHELFSDELAPGKREWFVRRGRVERMLDMGPFAVARALGCPFVLVPRCDCVASEEEGEGS